MKFASGVLTVSHLGPVGTTLVEYKAGSDMCPVDFTKAMGVGALDKLGRIITGALAAVLLQVAQRDFIAGQSIAKGPRPEIQVAHTLPKETTK